MKEAHKKSIFPRSKQRKKQKDLNRGETEWGTDSERTKKTWLFLPGQKWNSYNDELSETRFPA